MCKIYNLTGSLTAVKSHLLGHNINEFKSLNEVIAFQKNYSSSRQKIIAKQKVLIEEERKNLSFEILQLDNTIAERKIEIEKVLRFEIDKLKQQLQGLATASTSLINTFANYFKKHFIKNKIRTRELNLDSKISYPIRHLVSASTEKNNRHKYIDSHLMDAVYKSSLSTLRKLERKKKTIDEINTSIYGALGEQKVVKVLENLPDGCFLINDFSFTFAPSNT